MKSCNICAQIKPANDFGKEPRVKDGLQATCRSCKNKKNSQWMKNNRQKQSASVNKWRKKHPEKVSSYAEKYKERKKETNRIWHEKNKEKNLSYGRARRAKIKNLPTDKVTSSDVITKYGNICHICKTEINLDLPRRPGLENWELGLHIDHLIPIAANGSGKIENLRPSHGICNLRKGRNLK